MTRTTELNPQEEAWLADQAAQPRTTRLLKYATIQMCGAWTSK